MRSRTSMCILAAVAACVSFGTTVAAIATTDEAYTRPQRMVAIEQGRRPGHELMVSLKILR